MSLLSTTIVIIIITVVVVVVTLCKNMTVSSLRGWATPTDAYASSNEGRAKPGQASPCLALGVVIDRVLQIVNQM